MSQFHVDESTPHLGGYIIGGDDATYYPDLWRWLVGVQGVRSVLDLGCGEGHALRFFRDLGCRVTGYDGIEQDDPDIYRVDFSIGPADDYASGRNDWDLAWCCEFVEHVEEEHMHHYLSLFAEVERVLLTHAEPGQLGHHHVNCKTADYWIGAMAAIRFRLDPVMTGATCALARLNQSPYNHYARSGLAFVRF